MTESTIASQLFSEAAGHYHAIRAIRERAGACDEEDLAQSCLLAIALCFFEEQAKSELETITRIIAALNAR